jgi:Helix-turn-helix domain
MGKLRNGQGGTRLSLFAFHFQLNLTLFFTPRLWLPTETISVGSRPTSSSLSSVFMGQRSWFSQTTVLPPINMNSPRIFLPSTQSLSVNCKDGEPLNTEDSDGSSRKKRKRPKPRKSHRRAKRQRKADLTRSLKVRVYPNNSQKVLMKQWMGCARFVKVVKTYHHDYTSNIINILHLFPKVGL